MKRWTDNVSDKPNAIEAPEFQSRPPALKLTLMTQEWLAQEDVHEYFLALSRGPWTVVYRSWSTNEEDNGA